MSKRVVKPISMQSAVNRSFRNLYKQNCGSATISLANCMYRQDGTASCKIRCGVGHLIPNWMYHPKMEHNSIGDLIRDDECIDLIRLFKNIPVLFLAHLQSIHDNITQQIQYSLVRTNSNFFRETLIEKYEKLCEEYKLKMPKIPE